MLEHHEEVRARRAAEARRGAARDLQPDPAGLPGDRPGAAGADARDRPGGGHDHLSQRGRQRGRAAGHRRPGQAAVARRLGDALGGARRRLRDVRQGPDRFGADFEPDLPHSRRRAARRLLLRALPRRARPQDLQVEGQRPHGRRVAELRHQGQPEALHVPGAAQGQAALFRRHPAPCRRLLRAAGPLRGPGRGAALPQPGLAHPRRGPAAGRPADHLHDAAEPRERLQRRGAGGAVELHRALCAWRRPTQRRRAGRAGASGARLLPRLRQARQELPPAGRGRAAGACRARRLARGVRGRRDGRATRSPR